MQRKLIATLVAGALELLAGTVAHAAGNCAADAATPFSAGPLNPESGYAEYVKDSNGSGLALQLCTDPAYCFFDPVILGNLLSEQTGTGSEAFFWLADAKTDPLPSAFEALLVMATEATYNTPEPVDGEQLSFTRLRIRIDTPYVGTYTVNHPFGSKTYQVDIVGAGQEIRETIDTSFTPNSTAARGAVGPWLTWDTYPNDAALPAGYVGDGGTPHRVTGSPCNQNEFSISAVDADGVPIELGGPGSGVYTVSTNLFVVSGKVFDGKTQTNLAVDRLTYTRTPTSEGRIDAFAQGAPLATVTMLDAPSTATVNARITSALTLASDSAGLFSRNETLIARNSNNLPGALAVTATSGDADETTLIHQLVDAVVVTQADYDPATGQLLVNATSSDTRVPPTLTVAEFGTAVGVPVATTTPPATVTVISSRGGIDTANVRIAVSAAPSAPTELTLQGATGRTLTLGWRDNASNETRFDIYRNGAKVGSVGQNVTTFTDTGLSAATAYSYTVRAANASGEGVSASFDASTLALPVAPSGVAAALSTTLSRAINVSWVDNSGDETGFQILRSTALNGTYAAVGTVGAGVTTLVDQSGPPTTATTYYYRVVSLRGPDSSDPVGMTTGVTTPSAPTASAGTVTATATSGTQVNVGWVDRATNETGYQVWRRTGTGGAFTPISAVLAPNSASFSDTTVTAGTAYYYRVDVSNWAGVLQSAVVGPITPQNQVVLNAPTNLSATSVARPVLNWGDASANETGFRITRVAQTVNLSTGAFVDGASTTFTAAANATTFTEARGSATSGTMYKYSVQATNATTASAASNAAYVIPAAYPQVGVSLTRGVTGSRRITVAWTSPNTAAVAGYTIARCAAACTSANAVWTPVTTATATGSFVDNGLTAGTTYTYRAISRSGTLPGASAPFATSTGTASAIAR